MVFEAILLLSGVILGIAITQLFSKDIAKNIYTLVKALLKGLKELDKDEPVGINKIFRILLVELDRADEDTDLLIDLIGDVLIEEK